MNANPPASGLDQWPGSAALDSATGATAAGGAGAGPVAAAAPIEPPRDAAYLNAHYSAGGYSATNYNFAALPGEPLSQVNWSDWAYYLKNAIKAGSEPIDLLRQMQGRGCPEQPSYALMHEVVDGLHHDVRQEFLPGIALLALGLGVTVVTFNMASDGGTYFMLWGPMLAGAFIVLRGIWKWTQLPRY